MYVHHLPVILAIIILNIQMDVCVAVVARNTGLVYKVMFRHNKSAFSGQYWRMMHKGVTLNDCNE